MTKAIFPFQFEQDLFSNTDREAPRLLARRASIDHLPGPANNRKAQVISCAYSERISCNTAQKPTCGGTGGNGRGEVPRYSGIFVDAIATSISIMNGIAITRVRKPDSNRMPFIIEM